MHFSSQHVDEVVENSIKIFNQPLSTVERFDEMDIIKYTNTMNSKYTEDDIARLTELTTHNAEADTALLGTFEPNSVNSYEQIAHANGWTYFDAGNDGWEAMAKVDGNLAYRVNDEFLLKQIQEGKDFILTSNPYKAEELYRTKKIGKSFLKELDILSENGYKIELHGKYWRAYK
ncbi:hypothetical protein BVE84_09300 [Streptococcus azizii]|uniref:Uncharacterized protein n=2 Tax=Streptococcus TaxID=1301 RepID=A0AB36JNP8_9STRE|nr:hypothetical protein BVE86_08475 [Streptococcus azizii]ONK26146.1 hypothetical protein BVE85_09025 [Streptococcus azizii]ONK26389.1 hypothetical protein BVE84_09300 [Streptococcus azizii]